MNRKKVNTIETKYQHATIFINCFCNRKINYFWQVLNNLETHGK